MEEGERLVPLPPATWRPPSVRPPSWATQPSRPSPPRPPTRRPAPNPQRASSPAPSPDRLDRLDQLGAGLLCIPVQHARVVQIEQCVLDARESRAFAPLDDNDILGLVGIENGHA